MTPRAAQVRIYVDADVIVVGAGIAGLTATWHLRHLPLLVLKAAGRAEGGSGPSRAAITG